MHAKENTRASHLARNTEVQRVPEAKLLHTTTHEAVWHTGGGGGSTSCEAGDEAIGVTRCTMGDEAIGVTRCTLTHPAHRLQGRQRDVRGGRHRALQEHVVPYLMDQIGQDTDVAAHKNADTRMRGVIQSADQRHGGHP